MIIYFSILRLFSMAKFAIENKTPDSKEIETLLP